MRFGNLDSRSVVVARAFFHAATKLSDDDEDILPQEDSAEIKLSVYGLFSELFPEHVVSKECGSITAKTGLTRLQFNKLGYEMYVKEQSRRVPAPRAKPGNPGYGFRRAKWRNVSDGAEDQGTMQETLQAIGLPRSRCDYVRMRVDQFRIAWEQARRPSRPAGPGRPRGRARGDKAENTSPEPADTFVSTTKGMRSGVSTLPSPLSVDPAALQYVHQLEQMAAFRNAMERNQQQNGLSSPLVGGLLSQQRPLAPVQQLIPSVSQGMSGMLFNLNASNGRLWPASLPPQQPSLAGMNWGIVGGASGAAPFAADTLSKIHHQFLGGVVPMDAEKNMLSADFTNQQAPVNFHLAGLAPGRQGGGVGIGGISNSAGNHADLNLLQQACAAASALQAPKKFDSLEVAKRARDDEGSEDGEDDEDDVDDEDSGEDADSKKGIRSEAAKVEAASTKEGKKWRKLNGGRESGVGGSSCPSTSSRHMDTVTAAKLSRAMSSSSKPQIRGERERGRELDCGGLSKIGTKPEERSGSCSALSSSASTSVATSPATRALDQLEQHPELIEEECKNKASLTNLLTQ